MMNPQGGLASLVAALQGGMNPDNAFGIVQYLEQEQQQRMANRAQRLGGLASLLTDAASKGMPYEGAQAIAEAQPGPAGPAVQQMLSSLYPSAGSATPGLNPEYAQTQVDTDPTHTGTPIQGPTFEQFAAQRQSPVYQPDPLAQAQLQTAEAQAFQAQQAATYSAQWPKFQQVMTQARAQGKDPVTALQMFSQAGPGNAALVVSDPGMVRKIMENIWGQIAVQQAGMQQG